jgi:hypothetical protein
MVTPLPFSEALPLEPGDARRCELNRIGGVNHLFIFVTQ